MVEIKNPKEELRSFIPYLGVLILSVITLYWFWQERESIGALGSFGYLGLFLANALANATIILATPVALTAFVGGGILNPFLVGIVSGLGAAVGELVGYLLGASGKDILNRLGDQQKQWLEKTELWLKKGGMAAIFLVSLIPNPFFDLVGIAVGILDYPLGKFFLATAAGRILRNLLLALSGAVII